ncbi:FAD binding domain-containing protein [Thermoflavimicrobium daqui]|uniref:Xanthine dehydrogenase family protein subunit M n=1 Tax=Thermoflavimicrobium daqui TaxID=2137476 RepID=A0A364K9U0_9BACL|nr:xanthine dehydrogenase family protein subunit M [Thermoflavimicrobium daqui]RAL27061.1 xanthine dehydrogenase family protein subunit M [Thermoflavimicrobium daqui]
MRVSEIAMVTPKTVMECLMYLSNRGQDARLLAGGTDAIVQMKEKVGRPKIWINIGKLDELRFIREVGNEIHIGSLSTHTELANSKLIRSRASVLAEAAERVGATQIRNMGTIGGNIATASPAGDTLPALYVLDAELELQSFAKKRRIKIADFFLGPRRTLLQNDEIITKIIIKPMQENEIGIFEKLGPRRAQAISIVNVAIKLSMGSKARQCLAGKIAFGSVAPTIVRASKCEAMLTLGLLTDQHIEDIGKVAWREVSPISDIRASAIYRKDMAGALLIRGLYRLMKRWEDQ